MVFYLSLGILWRHFVAASPLSTAAPSTRATFLCRETLSMYEAYWGLAEKPFQNTPDPRFLYRSESLTDLYTRLLYTLTSRHGAALISGDSGCGKTMVARALLHELDPAHTEIALMSNPCRTAEEFLRELLYQLGEEGADLDRSRLVHRIHETVFEAYGNGRETVVVLDEAQLLEDPGIFEEIRLLLNLQLDDAFLITLLLVGQPALAERIRKQPALDQRIATRGFLRPFDEQETHDYVHFRLQTAGREEAVFTDEALQQVHDYAQGVPRRINNICDIALVIGYSRKLESIDGDWMSKLIQSERGDGA